MEIVLKLVLPRDILTVPVARRLVDSALRAVGVRDESANDVTLALTEACTNVLQHSGPGDEYEVSYTLTNGLCSIKVTDTGHGFDFASLAQSESGHDAERGRGVLLMRALVDRLSFESKPTAGSVVHLEKVLDYADDSLLARAISGSVGGD